MRVKFTLHAKSELEDSVAWLIGRASIPNFFSDDLAAINI